jgi:hypothetical protein
LLGSAGLNLAVCWKLKGGSGCTCLDPLAYDLREHEIFELPGRIDRGKMISIATPADFSDELEAKEIKVLPLVADIHQKRGMPGWCTHALDFARLPDVEFFCGGVNSQTPTSAGLWRQGNLLHFGFEQSPPEMNESGKQLLLNSIAYISRFTEDRPIAVTPSVFAGPVARSRATLGRWLRVPSYSTDFGKDVVASLKRYVPMGPKSDSADEWDRWRKESEAFVFASDAGDYRWYIDPLAKRRGVPVAEMRGPRRADRR